MGSPGVCGGGCAVHITTTPQSCVQGAAGLPLPLSKWLLFLYGWLRGLLHVLCLLGSPLHPSVPSTCAPCFCQVPLLPSCQPVPTALLPAWGCGVQDLGPGLHGRHGADPAPHLSNKRILSQRWMLLFMGLGAGIWLCAELGSDGRQCHLGGDTQGLDEGAGRGT